ncbi:ADA1A-like protein, partial [Mya arenaria]
MASSMENSSNLKQQDELYLTITWDKILIGIVLYMVTLVTILGNILVLVAVKINRRLQTTFNYYIVNLAITDVAVGLTAMSFQATFIVFGRWPFGEVLCALWIFFDYGMTFVSVFTLILISIDRFWSIAWALQYRHRHTKRKGFMLLLWVPAWIADRVRYSEPGVCFWDPSLNKEFVFIVAILGHHGPYCIMIFCYTYVFIFMRKRSKITDVSFKSDTKTVTQTITVSTVSNDYNEPSTSKVTNVVKINVKPKQSKSLSQNQFESKFSNHLEVPTTKYGSSEKGISQSKQSNRMAKDRRAFITLTYILFGYAILWLPFHIVFDISIVDPALVPEQVLNLAFWMAYINSTLNPLLYNFSSPDFRKTFKQLLMKCWPFK